MGKNDLSKLEKQFHEDAKLIVKHAIDNDVPGSWYWQHLEGYVQKLIETTHSDVDYLLSKGDEADQWYDRWIKEYTRRKLIFGKKEQP